MCDLTDFIMNFIIWSIKFDKHLYINTHFLNYVTSFNGFPDDASFHNFFRKFVVIVEGVRIFGWIFSVCHFWLFFFFCELNTNEHTTDTNIHTHKVRLVTTNNRLGFINKISVMTIWNFFLYTQHALILLPYRINTFLFT